MKLHITKQEGEKVKILEREMAEHDLKDVRLLALRGEYDPAGVASFMEALREFTKNTNVLSAVTPQDSDIETYTFETDLTNLPTCELVEELKKREGVDSIEIEPYAEYSVSGNGQDIKDTGPSILFVVTD